MGQPNIQLCHSVYKTWTPSRIQDFGFDVADPNSNSVGRNRKLIRNNCPVLLLLDQIPKAGTIEYEDLISDNGIQLRN